MDGYLAEIRLFAGTFAPLGYNLCLGQLLSIAENTALFSLLGTTYGGDGQTTFALPDMRGRVPVGSGQGIGLSPYDEGQVGGNESVTMTNATMPIHNHGVIVNSLTFNITPKALSTAGSGDTPNQQYFGSFTDGYNTVANATFNMATQPVTGTAQMALSGTGGGQPFENRSPYLGMNFIICVEGIYPSRN